jgi:hypothetical protein
VPHLELYPHHRGPLDVVDLGEGRPPAVGTDVPDNGMDPMVTMVPVRRGRAAPPIKAAISVNPAVGASAPVWAAAAVRDTTAARASAPVRAAAMTPLGVHGCPLHHLLPRCLPYQLELVERATAETAVTAARAERLAMAELAAARVEIEAAVAVDAARATVQSSAGAARSR